MGRVETKPPHARPGRRQGRGRRRFLVFRWGIHGGQGSRMTGSRTRGRTLAVSQARPPRRRRRAFPVPSLPATSRPDNPTRPELPPYEHPRPLSPLAPVCYSKGTVFRRPRGSWHEQPGAVRDGDENVRPEGPPQAAAGRRGPLHVLCGQVLPLFRPAHRHADDVEGFRLHPLVPVARSAPRYSAKTARGI